eukprot:jgi/Botrbrau1/20043/Bobra.200_1s0048.1
MVGSQNVPFWEISKDDNFASLAAFILFPVVSGSLIGVYSSKDVKKWFPTIKKPSWQASKLAFRPGLDRPICSDGASRLGCARAISFALIEIIWLWIAIVLTIISFDKVEPLAAALLLPYLAWVSFATFLNYIIVQLNPQGSKTGGQLEKYD